MSEIIIEGVKKYYSDRIKEFGNNHLGVDWNSKEGQYLRFEQLCNVIDTSAFSVLDYGCGYAELVNYLNKKYNTAFSYCGFDISELMIDEASLMFKDNSSVNFVSKLDNLKYDYVVGSGLFNVKLELATNNGWLDYIHNTLIELDNLSLKGFSFNALTSYSDEDYKKDYLYYSDPCHLFDFCKKHFSRNVALLHDYDLYEFTIVVKK